ncbi:DUF697 domain-containing protein [Candidatus Parabeggiatoa sp. HSG14]|uniref:YcjF family protein n=1 Tax=Candidatus Parabeggiatoa sp. HSG14 TaxID=3055593 RepID=UPI0025A693AB|nr:DUF697 domain-containing protein [Thiotrichales bacterium HSG14]
MDKTSVVIRNYVASSMATALIPVPLLDLVAISSLRLKMLKALAILYGIEFSRKIGDFLITTLLGGIMPLSIISPIASTLKIIPGIGQTSGMLTLPILEGAATYAIGKIFVRHFESGGTLRDFDPKKAKKSFASEFKEGQRVAAELNKK